MVSQCHAKLGPFTQQPGKMVSQCYRNYGTILLKGLWKRYHSVKENVGTIYTTTRWHHNVLQTLGPFTWREGEWYHSVMQNLQITYTTARGNGITVWCKTLGPFIQHPEEMVTQCYTNWRTIYTMPWENGITFWGKTLGPKLWHTQHPK